MEAEQINRQRAAFTQSDSELQALGWQREDIEVLRAKQRGDSEEPQAVVEVQSPLAPTLVLGDEAPSSEPEAEAPTKGRGK